MSNIFLYSTQIGGNINTCTPFDLLSKYKPTNWLKNGLITQIHDLVIIALISLYLIFENMNTRSYRCMVLFRHLCVHTHIYIYIYIYTHMLTQRRTFMYRWTCKHTYMHIYIYIYMKVYVSIYSQ